MSYDGTPTWARLLRDVAPHETTTASGITIPDADQGTPCIAVQFAMPSTLILVYEPFDDGTEGGHNLAAFAQRWAEWEAGDEPFLAAIEPRFGHRQLIPRVALGENGAVQLAVVYHRKEDVRAGHRAVAVPGEPSVRRRSDGAFEIAIPR